MKNVKTVKAENGKIYDIIYWEDPTLKKMISYQGTVIIDIKIDSDEEI